MQLLVYNYLFMRKINTLLFTFNKLKVNRDLHSVKNKVKSLLRVHKCFVHTSHLSNDLCIEQIAKSFDDVHFAM